MSHSVLAIAEQTEGVFKKVTYEALSEGRRIADQMNAELITLVLGSKIEDVAASLFLIRFRWDCFGHYLCICAKSHVLLAYFCSICPIQRRWHHNPSSLTSATHILADENHIRKSYFILIHQGFLLKLKP